MATTLASLIVRIGADLSGLSRNLTRAERQVERFGSRMQSLGRGLTASVTLPIIGIGAAATKAAVDFESSFAGIRKTMDLTEAEFQRLARANRDLAKEIPVAVDELNRIGELAGQLGIRGVDNVLKFERTISQLAVTTDLTAEAGALAFAQIANVMQVPQDQIDRLGATVVGLGNNFATTESKIVDFTQRIAGAGQIAGLSVAEVVGIGTAFASLGVEAEAGGTAVQKVLLGMVGAVQQGGEQLEVFAATAGMSASQFRDAFNRDAAGAFTAFVEGLGRQGRSAIDTLDALGLADQRLTRAFLAAAGAGDLLRQAVTQGNAEFEKNTALTDEAGKRFQTAESQLRLFWNRLRDTAITLGTALVPALLDALDAMQPLLDMVARMATGFADLDPRIQAFVLTIAALAAALGPVLVALGSFVAFLPQIGILLGSLAGPVGIITGLLVAGAGAWAAWRANAESAAKTAREAANEAARALDASIAGSALDELEARNKELREQIGALRQMPQTALVRGQLAEREAELRSVIERLIDLRDAAKKASEEAAKAGEAAESAMAGVGETITEDVINPVEDAAEAVGKLAGAFRSAKIEADKLAAAKGAAALVAGQKGFTPSVVESAPAAPGITSPVPTGPSDSGGAGGIMAFLSKIGSQVSSQIMGIVAQFGPLAAVAAALKPVFDGLRETLGPIVAELAEPLRIVGQLLGSVIAPILKLLAPPLRLLATIVSYVVEGLGQLVRALGKAIDALPFISAKGLIRAGESMIESAKDARKALDTTTDGMQDLGKAVSAVTSSLVNYARVQHINALRFAIGGSMGGGGVSGGASGGAGNQPGGGPVVRPGHRPPITINVVGVPAEVQVEQHGRIVQRAESRGGTTRFSLAT